MKSLNRDSCISLTQAKGVIQEVSNFYGANIMSSYNLNSRRRIVLVPRQISMYLISRLVNCTTPFIGDIFNKHHATVLHANKTISDLLEYDAELRNELKLIEINIISKVDFSKDKKYLLLNTINEKLYKMSVEELTEISLNINKYNLDEA